MSQDSLTVLLRRMAGGEREAVEALMTLVYGELRQLASQQRRRVPSAQLLNTTALVHELYERFSHYDALSFEDRQHFFAVSAKAMRQILLNEAQRRQAVKRGGPQTRGSHVELDKVQDAALIHDDKIELILQVHQGLQELAKYDQSLVQVVEYRFFVGMTYEEIALLMDSSEATAKRQWRRARAWLMTFFEGAQALELGDV